MSSKVSFVITGGSGFIATAVCRELACQGYQVVAYTRKKEHLSLSGIRYEYVEDYRTVVAPKDAVCIHLAAQSSVRQGQGVLQAERSKKDACDVASHLRDQGFRRLVFASTAQVYGDRSIVPHKENGPVSVTGFYLEEKIAVEQIILQAGQAIARIANVYGEGMSPYNVLSTILSQLENSEAVRIRDASPMGDFIHVSDVAQGLIRLALSDEKGVFNFGTGKATRISELAQMILRIAGQEKRSVLSSSPGTPSCLILDPSKMRDLLGWVAKVALQDGLKALLVWHRAQFHGLRCSKTVMDRKGCSHV